MELHRGRLWANALLPVHAVGGGREVHLRAAGGARGDCDRRRGRPWPCEDRPEDERLWRRRSQGCASGSGAGS